MSSETKALTLPPYADFESVLTQSQLPYTGATLHGLICAFLTVGQSLQAEKYLRALLQKNQQGMTRRVMLAVFSVYAVAQQQISSADFQFQLMLPDDNEPIKMRGQAFSEWCQGYLQGLALSEAPIDEIEEEDVTEALHHLNDFAELDYERLEDNEEDERALVEIIEYTRVAVLRIRDEFIQVSGVKDGQTHH